MDAEADPPTMEEVDPPPMEVIPVKCEIIEISDEEVNTEIKPRSRRKRPLDPNLRAKCDICDKIFGDKHQLRKHLVVHSEARPFICQLCGNTFRYKHTLKSHELTHSGRQIVQCENCAKMFGSKSQLRRHMQVHNKEAQFACQQCGKTFRYKHSLDCHELLHAGKETPKHSKSVAQCEICAKMFGDNTQLRRHKIVHSKERPHACSQCEKTFRYKQHLKTHQLIHHAAEDVVKKCVCQICGAAFVRNSSLKIHIKIHTGEKPYQCHLCPKTFIQKANLTHHIKVHQGERNFECTECAKKFITQAKLRQHSKKHIKKKLKELHMTSVQKVPKKRPPILPPKDVDTELSDENDDDECPSKVSNSPLWGSQVSDDESILS